MRTKKFYLLGISVVLGLFSLSGSKAYGQQVCDCTVDNQACADELCGNNLNKIKVCHQPTANLHNNENAKGPEERPDPKTLCVSETAAQHHIENHGDDCGACSTEE